MSVWGRPVLTGAGRGSGVTVTGNPAVIMGNGSRFTRLECAGLPLIQNGSGDPSPSNIRPILPYSAVDYLWSTGNLYDSAANPIVQGSITAATGEDFANNNRIKTDGYIAVTGGSTLYADCNTARIALFFYESDYTYITGESTGWLTPPAQISMPQSAAYVRAILAKATDTSISPSDFSYLTLAEADTYTWTPGSGETLWMGVVDPAAGTLTNGRVYLELDGTEDWIYIAASGSGYPYCRIVLPAQTWSGTAATVACSHFVGAAIASSNKSIGIRVQVSNSIPYLFLRRTSSDTAASTQAWLAEQKQAGTPVQVLYTLLEAQRTPVPIARQTINSKVGENRIATVQGTSITAALGGGSGLIYIS